MGGGVYHFPTAKLKGHNKINQHFRRDKEFWASCLEKKKASPNDGKNCNIFATSYY